MQYGIVLDVNPSLEDVLVLDNAGELRWWNHQRWRILRKAKKDKKRLDFSKKPDIIKT